MLTFAWWLAMISVLFVAGLFLHRDFSATVNIITFSQKYISLHLWSHWMWSSPSQCKGTRHTVQVTIVCLVILWFTHEARKSQPRIPNTFGGHFHWRRPRPILMFFLGGGNSWPLPEQVWTKLVDNFPWFQAVHFFYLHAIDALQPASSPIFSCWPPSQLWLLLSKSAASLLHHIVFRLCHQVINIFRCTDQCYQTWNVRQPSLPFRPKPDSQKVNSVCHYSCTYFVNSLTFSFLSCFSRTSRWSCRLCTLISLVEGRVTRITAFALAATSGHFSGKR